jgi:hypothetical protein
MDTPGKINYSALPPCPLCAHDADLHPHYIEDDNPDYIECTRPGCLHFSAGVSEAVWRGTSEPVAGAVPASVRKGRPVCTGVLDYFPDAIQAVAECSLAGNEQHNPGSALHWDRAKSGDESDALMRHLIERGTLDTDGLRHTAKVAWRALALLQKEIELERA